MSSISNLSLRDLPGTAPGIPDYRPSEQNLINRMKDQLAKVYQLNGFNPLDLAPLVRREFLLKKGGINNEIFSVSRIHTDEPTSLGLIFDQTVPLALYVRDYKKELLFPFKRYAINFSFRGENPSPGRFQAFYQCDADIVGPNLSIQNDVQCISALVEGLNTLLNQPEIDPSAREFTMYLNHFTIPKGLFEQAKVPDEKIPEAMRIVDKMEKIGEEEVVKLLTKLLSEDISKFAIDELVKIFSYKGAIENFSLPEIFPEGARQGLQQLSQIIEMLKSNGIPEKNLLFSPGMVRGLNYYSGVLFETFLNGCPEAGSVMSGGRYDELVDTFTADVKGRIRQTGIQGVGGSIGLTRLVDVLLRAKILTPSAKTACKVMVATRGLFDAQLPWQIAKKLREQNISCDVYTGNSTSLKKQLNYADRNGYKVVVSIMDSDIYCVKDLRNKHAEEMKDLTNLTNVVDVVQSFLQNK